MYKANTSFMVLVLVIGSLLLAGCLNFQPKDDPSRFYTLSSLAIAGGGCGSCEGGGRVIGMARVVIPDYLDREKIVTEIQPNELYIAEYQYWAESLRRGITRVMTENLSALMPGATILPTPWQSYGKPDVELRINIIDFKPQMYCCQTLLIVRYSIMDIKDSNVLYSEELCLTVPLILGRDSYVDITRSMSEALCQLSQRIACRL